MTGTLSEQRYSIVGNKARLAMPADLDEIVVFCPKCKTLETLYFSTGQLIQTRKFNQNDGHIYHDCGSNEPCRVYHSW